MAESRLERVGLRLFSALLRLLPAELAHTAGAEMSATFAARQRDARARGVAALLVLWTREAGGLLAAAARGRLGGGARGAATPIAEGLGQDARYVMRSLARSPGFTATALVVIALGVGAATGIFSAVNAVIL